MKNIFILNQNVADCSHYNSARVALLDSCDFLLKPQKHNHELLILTCYVDLDILVPFYNELAKKIKISKIRFLFDFSEVYRIGPVVVNEKVKSIQKKFKGLGINFEYAFLASSNLTHSKGYAVLQKNAANEIIAGFALITSSNFTKPGFEGENVEIGQLSFSKKIVREFEEVFENHKNKFGKTKIDKQIFEQEEYLFHYALLESGVFLHKWAGNLKQDLAISYNLTETAVKKIKQGVPFDLAENSFSLGKKLMRKVLELETLPEKLVPKSFITSYTIETFWGRWCPKSAWEYLIAKINPEDEGKGEKNFDEFYKAFKKITSDEKLKEVVNAAIKIQNDLISNGHVKPVKEDHLKKWSEKVENIRDSENDRLSRYFLGYEVSSLPYMIEQKKDVERLFSCVKDSIDISRTVNKARDKMNWAIENKNPFCLEIDENDMNFIDEIISRHQFNNEEDDEEI